MTKSPGLGQVRPVAPEDTFTFQEMLDRLLPRVCRLIALRAGRTHLSDDVDMVRRELHARLRDECAVIEGEAELFHATMCACLPKLRAGDTASSASRHETKESTGNTGGSLDQDAIVEWRVPFARTPCRERKRWRIERALMELPHAQRDVLVLRHYLGFSFQRIAAELDLDAELDARILHATASHEMTRRLNDRPQVST